MRDVPDLLPSTSKQCLSFSKRSKSYFIKEAQDRTSMERKNTRPQQQIMGRRLHTNNNTYGMAVLGSFDGGWHEQQPDPQLILLGQSHSGSTINLL